VTTEEAQPDTVADLPGGDIRIYGVDDPDDLVTGNDRLARIGPESFDAEGVAVANAAGEDTHADMAWLGFDDLALDEFELALSGDLESAICWHCDP
jgi:hypothetical protein